MNNIVSKEHPLKHDQWSNGCKIFELLNSEGLSVKQQIIPAGVTEQIHYHQYTQQFFFILAGKATFEIEGKEIEVSAYEGLHIQPGQKHRVTNNSTMDLELIICSQPFIANDRINL